MALSSDPPSTAKAAAAEGDASHQSVPLSTAAPAVVEYKESPENPRDFRGDVLTDDTPPDVATLRRTAELVVLDADGKAHSFRSLYEGEGVRPRDRVLVVFVRHFYCGNCQEYIRTLSRSLPPSVLEPANATIRIIGCGDPALIPMYISETGSQYPVYADPSRALYDALGMQKTLAMGPRQPKYMRRSMVRAAVVSIVQGLKQLRKGIWVAKSGDQRQVGGEFLFVPPPPPDGQSAGDQNGESKPKPFRTVQWCHRMRNTRDHSEVETLVEVLGLDPEAVRRAEEAADQREAHELLHGRADKAAAAVPYVNGKATTSVHDVPGGTAPAVPAKS